MGFDIECIVNIQSLAGEYFCPVCRLLVYPNEAIQSQCTHLYCKPCLTYVAGTTRACPYDNYLVTEADSKPLVESNKALADTIGNIAVHCLYHRSGCTWQGPLSECTSHCSGCAFGNSPVVCNRCGVQIVHRQVQEHAGNCSGVQTQTQQAVGAQDATVTGTASASADPSQTATQSVTPSSQAQISQTTTAPPPGQDPNQQSSGNPQAVQALTPEQWYQQQYQQYYQQYPGYDPYQQAYQLSYPYQQQAAQQFQQPPQQVQGLHQPQVYPQPQVQPQVLPQPQVQSHAQPQPRPQQQVHPPAQPPTQIQTQSHPPLGHPHPQPQPYPQGQPVPQPHSVQPHPQHVQMPQYQQPPPQMQHPQLPIQPHGHPQSQPQPQPPIAQPQAHGQYNIHSHPQINPPLQPNQPVNITAHPQTQHPPAHAVTGHQSYPQPQAVPQMQMGGPQHPMQAHLHSGPPPPHPPQIHNQFPQQPPQTRPPQSHVPVQNPGLLPPQGQVPSVPHAQQPMLHPHMQQPAQPVQQRPIMQPQQFVQQFPGQTSGPVQNQLYQQTHPVQSLPPPPPMQSHLRPPHSYPQTQQSVVHAPQPHQTQNYAGRPMVPNHGASSQPFSQANSGFPGPSQVRPMQHGANQQTVNLNHLARIDHQPPHMSSESFQSGMGLKHTMQEAGLPSQTTAKADANGLVPSGVGADSVEGKTLKFEAESNFLDNEQKPRVGDKDDSYHVDTPAKDADSKSHAVENGSGEVATKPMVKKEAIDGTVEPSLGGSEIVVEEQKDSSSVSADASSLHLSESLEVHDVKFPKDSVENAMLVSAGADKGSHGIPLAPPGELDSSVQNVAGQGNSDQERYQQPPMHYGPSTHHQRPTGHPITQPGPSPRPLHHGHISGQVQPILRPQGPGELSQPGQPLNPAEHFQTPAKQPYGSFPPDGLPGRNLGPGSTSSFGRGPAHFGPPQGSFDLQSGAPQGHYSHGPVPPHFGGGPPPGAFDSHGGVMGRAPPHGPEGHFVQQRPNSQMHAEIFPDQRSRNFDGRQFDPHGTGTWDQGPLGHPPGTDPNMMRMKRAPGIDSPSTLGYGEERCKPPPEEHLNPFPLEPSQRAERGSRPLDKPPHGDAYDIGSGAAPSRFGPPYHSPGTFHPNEAGERARPFGRHQMDHLTPRSPGREYPNIPPRGFGRVDDIDGREPRPFGEGSRSFNIPLDPVGNSFHGSRFPHSPSHLRRGEIDGPGSFRGGDIPGHLRFGDPSGLGVFPGHARMGELGGPRNLPHNLPLGDTFGGNKSSHPRLGEPGFRSSYSLQGFPNDGGFFASRMDSFDNSRKRKPTSMGWCRICRVDCETVEGLDMHSQTREHQKKSMDMVLNIKQQNTKRQRKSNDHSSREEASKSRSTGYQGRGNKV